MKTFLRSRAASAGLALAAVLAAPAVAREPGAAGTTSRTTPVPPGPAASSAPQPAGNDGIEALHRKLAERLGSVRQPTDDGSLVLKVPARPAARTASARGRPSRAEPVEHIEPTLHPVHWGYEGAGAPAAWAGLKPEYGRCGTGTRQSPIDIRDGIPVQLDPIEFDYRPSAFRVVDNGHTVQVQVDRGNTLSVSGRRYELVQFHFHRPSEERIEGRQFDMDVHLVHRDDQGRLAVVAVLLEQGGAQPVVQQVWNNLPLEKGEEQAALAPIDLLQLLPQDRRYVTYMGSLTTPPCSEGVLWMVMKQPVPVSAEQIEVFGRLYPMNARPVQPTFGRLIKDGR